MDTCPGHFGHIALNSPVYHAGMLRYLIKIMKCICFNCSKLLVCKVSSGTTDTSKQYDNSDEQEVREMLMKISNGKMRFRKLLSLAENI